MTPPEIEKRLYRCPHLRQVDLDSFVAEGVPPAALYRPDCVARARVEFDDQLPIFEFAYEECDGVPAFVLLARGVFGEAIDLVAWHPKSGRLGAWRGNARVLGGENLFKPRLCENGALIVHRTPLQWLQAARNGIVVIHERECADFLRSTGPLEVAERHYAARLRRALTIKGPRIHVVPSNVGRAS